MLTTVFYAAFLAVFFTTTLAVQTIEIKGSDFVNSVTGDRLQILGVAYQPGGSSGYNPGSGVDPLSDGSVCLRDAALMQRLGVNAIRVYNIDPNVNHDDCASIFNAVGIYMMIDVNSPLAGDNIDRSNPSDSYTAPYLQRTFGVVEAFKNYQNTLLFFSGNEVINDVPTGGTVPPYIRAVTRDLKNYISKHSKRAIPVGYSAADVRDILLDTWNYLQCTTTGDDSDPTRVDLFALNSYSWCGNSSYSTSQYDQLVSDFGNTSVPVFFSEYGCNVPSPRVFTEVHVLYGPLMTPVLSGGVVYEYSEEPDDFGLVTINSDGSVKLRTDYETLQQQYNTLDIPSLQSTNAQDTSVKAPPCDSSLIVESGFANDFTVPDIPSDAQDMIDNGISNPNNGKIVSVSDTKVMQPVQDSSGKTIQNLAISPLPEDQSNTPSNQTSTGTGSSRSSTGHKKSGVGKVEGTSVGALVVMLGLCIIFI